MDQKDAREEIEFCGVRHVSYKERTAGAPRWLCFRPRKGKHNGEKQLRNPG